MARKRRALPDGVDVPADMEDGDYGAVIGAEARRLDTVRAGGDEPEEMRVTAWQGWQRFVHTGAIPVEDGIRAKTRRGPIGITWWSQRFMSVVESLDLGGRLDRARTYARKGQVIDLSVRPGRISARVQGTNPVPYGVEIEVRRLGEGDWSRVIDAMAARAAFSAHLLSGEMPSDVEEAFAGARVSLFPAAADEMAMSCTCPDWSVPCKHVAAVLYLFAEQLDEDPFLLIMWRGMEKEDLLAAIRERRGQADTPSQPRESAATVETRPLEERLDDFWDGSDARLVHRAPEVPADVLAFARATDPSAALIRELVALPAYRRMVRMAAEAARRLAVTDPRSGDG